MGKTVRIALVEICNKDVKAYDANRHLVKLTRTQRQLFTRYSKPDFLEQIQKEFSANILDDDFKIIEPLSGIPIYSLK